jgi:hypothetical protein
VFVRDSGLVHALLGLNRLDAVLSYPVAGSSCEGCRRAAHQCDTYAQASLYRTSNGAEDDLVLEFRGDQTWAIVIKRSSAPTISKGLYTVAADLDAVRKLLAAPVQQPYPMKDGVEVMSLLLATLAISSQS